MADQEGAKQMVIHPLQVRCVRRSRRHYQHLPNDLLHNIFSLLPLKDAVQTSVLAKRFKKSWQFSQNLDFGEDFATLLSRTTFKVLVHKVLELHRGPKIQSFQLYFDHTFMEEVVDYWVTKSLSKEVNELNLDFSLGFTPFTLPPNLLDSESLRILKLTNCQVHCPSQLKGLAFLSTLILKRVNVTEQLIKKLFNNCLLLETLGLTRCREITYLKVFAGNLKRFKELRVENCYEIVKVHIDAPTLRTMYYSGDIETFTIGNVLRLKDVIVKTKEGFLPFVGMERFMFAISHVEVLTITSEFVKELSPRIFGWNLDKVLQYHFWNLRELELFMKGSLCGPVSLVTFLKRCPLLEKITINMEEHSFCLGFYWEVHQGETLEELNIGFKSLKSVTFNGFTFEKPVKKLVKFILRKANALEKLVLDTTNNGWRSRTESASLPTPEQLNRFKQANPGVRIIVY